MKYVLIIPDGCADEPQASLGGKTPLQAAQTPNMDAVAKAGIVGRVDHVPASMPSGSDVGTMSLFGYDPLKYHTGRAPLEAAAQGIELGPHDWAVRCNLVTIVDGMMKSFTAGQIANDVGRELIELVQRDVESGGDGETRSAGKAKADASRWRFYPGVSYRNLLIYRGEGGTPPFGADTETVPPHDITDQPVAPHLPKGTGADLLRDLMRRSEAVFPQSPLNQARKERGELAATGIWLWGQGSVPALTPFYERFGKRGAVITAVDLLRGLGRLLGWKIVEVPGATGYLDTDYAAKGRYAIETLKDVDFVVVHVEATDEASHEGHAEAKVEALERIDRDIVAPVHEWLRSQGDYRLVISPDHPTFLRTKTHSHGYVPFAMCGSAIASDTAATYDEVAGAASSIAMPGHELMPMFFGA